MKLHELNLWIQKYLKKNKLQKVSLVKLVELLQQDNQISTYEWNDRLAPIRAYMRDLIGFIEEKNVYTWKFI